VHGTVDLTQRSSDSIGGLEAAVEGRADDLGDRQGRGSEPVTERGDLLLPRLVEEDPGQPPREGAGGVRR
jgi:hypothetical protein